MQKQTSLLLGVTLILLAAMALAGNLIVQATGHGFHLGFRSWPIFVVAAGLLFCLPPFIFTKARGLGGLFIPGIPVLTTGVLLFIASVSGRWGVWSYLWPMEVIGVALGFVMAAIFLRVIWLMIPASIVGLTGLVLQFCAITGWWASWAVLWTVEPLSVGLPLLIIGIARKIDGVKLAGLILCGFAGIAFAAMSSILIMTNWIMLLVGPAIVMGLGIYLVLSALLKRPAEKAETPTENQAA